MEYIPLYQNNKFCFDIVFNKNIDMELPRYTSAETFRKTLCELLEEDVYSPKALKLISDAGCASYKDKVSVMWGKTDYPEAVEVYENIAPNEYGFCVSGNKIVIYGNTLDEIKTGAAAFIAELKENLFKDENGNTVVKLPKTAAKRYSNDDLAILQIPVPTVGASVLFCDDGDGARMWVAEGCVKEDFDIYTKELEIAGFALYSKNEIENNLSKTEKTNKYATYTKDDIIADVWYTIDGYLRITASRGFYLPLATVEKYNKVSETGLTVVGPDEETDRGEQLMFFRLEDGSFFIIDAGMHDCRWNLLYDELKKQAPDPNNIVIRCWMFTHSHGDHIGALVGLSDKWDAFKDKVTIESFMYNFAGYEQSSVPRQGLSGTDKKLREIFNTIFSDVKKIKAHPGNVFDFANMHLEVLSTHESSIKNQYPMPRNACNLAVKITVEGQTVIIMGDTSVIDNETVEAVYGDYLKCDILQPAHHGYVKGALATTNLLHSPIVVLFMASQSGGRHPMDRYIDRDFNQALLDPKQNPNFKEYICHDRAITYLPLPYIPNTKIITTH